MRYLITLIFFFFPSVALAQEISINSVSTDFISILYPRQTQTTTLALTGDNLSEIIYNEQIEIYFHDLLGYRPAGNNQEINISFDLNSDLAGGQYRLRLKNGQEIIYESEKIQVFNPYHQAAAPEKKTKPQVGLNVHQAQAATADEDDNYLTKLQNSNTKWVREHLSHQHIMGPDSAAWITRYDKILKQYQDNDIRVVAMLAYDKDENYAQPSLGAWKKYVRRTVKRYKNYVDVWEVWNEPDSKTYLNPSTVDEYKSILKSSYRLIKYYDPDSTVLNGGLADITHLKFADSLYRRAHNYFDAFNIHLYYCDEYQHNQNNNAQRVAIENLEKIIFKGRRKKPVWITELGCSTNTLAINRNTQRDYLKKSTNYLLSKDYLKVILLYTLRDRDLADSYEAKFGLMDLNFKNKKAWAWYRRLNKD